MCHNQYGLSKDSRGEKDLMIDQLLVLGCIKISNSLCVLMWLYQRHIINC